MYNKLQCGKKLVIVDALCNNIYSLVPIGTALETLHCVDALDLSRVRKINVCTLCMGVLYFSGWLSMSFANRSGLIVYTI